MQLAVSAVGKGEELGSQASQSGDKLEGGGVCEGSWEEVRRGSSECKGPEAGGPSASEGTVGGDNDRARLGFAGGSNT